MPRKCANINFCYVCGNVTSATQRRPITPLVKTAYHHYFGVTVGDQEKPWVPHICCNSCSVNLVAWLKNKGRSMRFGVPMIWREPRNHVDDFYFCLVAPLQHGTSRKKKGIVEYPNIPSDIRPVPHRKDLCPPLQRNMYWKMITRKNHPELDQHKILTMMILSMHQMNHICLVRVNVLCSYYFVLF